VGHPKIISTQISEQNILMSFGWGGPTFNIMSDSPALHSKWLLLQKIEISFVFNIRFITNQNELKC
jgi:hypothetical protein